MDDLIHWLFSAENFMPHGHCFLWQPGTLWLNVGSDALIALSYFLIPIALYYFIRQRKNEIPYAWLPLMFAAFILLCGATHAMEIWTVWNPIYRQAGALKLMTGIVSFSTLVSLAYIMPHAMLLQSPRQLQTQVDVRTAELVALNATLRAEITARGVAEQELRHANRRKDEFLAVLAHELRNPLAPIRNSLKLLESSDVQEPQRQWGAKVIARQVHRMALLLDDLLDVSRISRGKLNLKPQPVDLGSLIGSAVETATPLMDAKQHHFKLEMPDEQITVEVDPLRVSQALANILMNAAKYTDEGGTIVLAVRVEPEALTIIVSDTGIGFEMADLAAMFEMFSQVSAPGDRPEGGLGIGLALVKGLVGLHGGTVEARSAGIGRGAEFIIRLPGSVVVDTPVNSALEPASVALSGGPGSCKILVADDNRDSSDSLGLLLEYEGNDVLVTYSGHQALEKGREGHPDVVILDIGMPDMTGYEAARRIRQEEWGRSVLLVAMTGWGQAEDKERAKAAGFDRHLTKPIDPSELQGLISAFLSHRNGADPGQKRMPGA
jgi:signal transduction histidine kinase/ActR/RegA family two-component response regulator